MQTRTAAVRAVGEVYLKNDHLRSHTVCETLMHRMKDTAIEVRIQVRTSEVPAPACMTGSAGAQFCSPCFLLLQSLFLSLQSLFSSLQSLIFFTAVLVPVRMTGSASAQFCSPFV